MNVKRGSSCQASDSPYFSLLLLLLFFSFFLGGGGGGGVGGGGAGGEGREVFLFLYFSKTLTSDGIAPYCSDIQSRTLRNVFETDCCPWNNLTTTLVSRKTICP